MGYNGVMPEGHEIPLAKPTKHPEQVRSHMREGLTEKMARKFTALGLLLNRSRGRNEALQQQVEVLGKEAFTDPLTGAYNRRYFDERLTDAFTFTKRGNAEGPQMGVLMFDLDHFKAVNDRFGHEAGDEVLKKFVQTMQGSIREEDVLARYGGEEFVLLITDVAKMTHDQLATLAERFRERIADNIHIGPDKESVTASIGLCLFPQNSVQIEKPEDLLKYADTALYHAKRGGRNQVLEFTGFDKEGNPQFSRVEVSPKG